MYDTILAMLPLWLKTTVEIGYCVFACLCIILGMLMVYNIYQEPLEDDDTDDGL